MKYLFFIVLLLPSVVIAKPAIVQMKDISKANEPLVRQAIQSIADACPGFTEFWGDVESASVVRIKNAESDFRNQNYGWSNYIQFIIKIKEPADKIIHDHKAWRNNLFFEAGGNIKPGVLTRKKAAIRFCKGSFNTSDLGVNYFMPLQKMSIINKLQ